MLEIPFGIHPARERDRLRTRSKGPLDGHVNLARLVVGANMKLLPNLEKPKSILARAHKRFVRRELAGEGVLSGAGECVRVLARSLPRQLVRMAGPTSSRADILARSR